MKISNSRPLSVLILILLMLMGISIIQADDDDSREVKVLTIVMFEIGNVIGDFPGEAQAWVENEGLNEIVDVPGLLSPVRCNSAGHCLVITGIGVSNAASSVAILGSSDKFDLSQAYILVAGVAGVDPADGTIGSAAWADWVVDGDIAHHIDAREMPPTFAFPLFRFGCIDPTQPFCSNPLASTGTEVFQLNTRLVDWAFNLTQNLTLTDSAIAQGYRANYPAHLPAAQPPAVIRCDSLGSVRFWHGQRLSNWANWWVLNWTGGQGNYCMTNQEDAATMTALFRLSLAEHGRAGLQGSGQGPGRGRVDLNRVLVLRTAGAFDQQLPSGQTAIESLGTDAGGFIPSLTNAYLVGSTVTDYIIENWDDWEDGPPPLGR